MGSRPRPVQTFRTQIWLLFAHLPDKLWGANFQMILPYFFAFKSDDLNYNDAARSLLLLNLLTRFSVSSKFGSKPEHPFGVCAIVLANAVKTPSGLSH